MFFLSRAARRFRCAPGSTNAGESVGNTFAGQTRTGPWHLPAMPGPRPAHSRVRRGPRCRGSGEHEPPLREMLSEGTALGNSGPGADTAVMQTATRSSCWRRQQNERECGSMLRTGRPPPPGSLCSALQRSLPRGGSCARATGAHAPSAPHSLNRWETTTRPRMFCAGTGPNWRLSREFHWESPSTKT